MSRSSVNSPDRLEVVVLSVHRADMRIADVGAIVGRADLQSEDGLTLKAEGGIGCRDVDVIDTVCDRRRDRSMTSFPDRCRALTVAMIDPPRMSRRSRRAVTGLPSG